MSGPLNQPRAFFPLQAVFHAAAPAATGMMYPIISAGIRVMCMGKGIWRKGDPGDGKAAGREYGSEKTIRNTYGGHFMQSTLKGQSFPPLPFPFTSIYNYLTFPWGSTNHRPSVPCHDKNNCRSIIRRLVSPSSTFPAALFHLGNSSAAPFTSPACRRFKSVLFLRAPAPRL